MRFGILQRYVSGEVFRSFALALTTLTAIFVLIMVMAEASKVGLSPTDILRLIPVAIPGTLPYSVPVSLLFAVTVVFGRIAADNEVIAIKTAGLSAWAVLWPAMFLGAVLSSILLYISAGWIPYSNHQVKLVIFKNMEDMLYKVLKKERVLDNHSMPFLIQVKDVEGKTLIEPIFKHRVSKEQYDTFDTVIVASKAVIQFMSDEGVARVYLDGAEVLQPGNISLINRKSFDIDLPRNRGLDSDKKSQEMTNQELVAEKAKYQAMLDSVPQRLAIETAFSFGTGRLGRLNWGTIQHSISQCQYWKRRVAEFETEKQLRFALSFGSLFFVLLGAPVGIRFARRDFLSAFITCFLPIILAYYPLMLLGVNLGREGVYPPVQTLWIPNIVLVALFAYVTPPVIRH